MFNTNFSLSTIDDDWHFSVYSNHSYVVMKPTTVRCRYNAVNCHLNPYKRHPIGRPPGQDRMTSSNGKIFHATGPLCGEFTGPGEFPTQRPVTRSFDVFFDLRLNKRLSKQTWGWWFETQSWSLWRQCNVWCVFCEFKGWLIFYSC